MADGLRQNKSLRELNLQQFEVHGYHSIWLIFIHILVTIRDGHNDQLALVQFTQHHNDTNMMQQVQWELGQYTGWNRSGFRKQLPLDHEALWATLLSKAATHPSLLFQIMQRNVQAIFS